MTLLTGTLGTEMLDVGDVTLVVTPLWKAGLVWNDPAAWQADRLTIEKLMISASKLMRHIGGSTPPVRLVSLINKPRTSQHNNDPGPRRKKLP